MKILVNRIVNEFNKIFSGSKRVGDSLKLEGKRMTELDVANSAKLGNKSESQLSVSKAVTAEKSGLLQSFDSSGNPKVTGNGDPVYIKENQLSVLDSKKLNGVDPINLEVDIAKKLRYSNDVIISVSNLFQNPHTYTVVDSGKLGGKLESELVVKRSVDANNADLLNNKQQNQLVVEKSRISSKLLSTDGSQELLENALQVLSAVNIKDGNNLYNLSGIRDWLVTQTQMKSIVPDLSTNATNIVFGGGGSKNFSEIMTYIKNDSTVEAYKATRLVTGDNTTPIKTGDQVKDWIIGHNDFKTKVASLTSALADRAVRFGSDTDSVNITELDARIKNTVVNTATNSTTVAGQTPDNIMDTLRSRILTNSGGNGGLTQSEVDGFFGNAKVKLATQAIKVNNAIQADKLTNGGSFVTYDGILTQVKTDGQVSSAKVIYTDPTNFSSGTKSYVDITSDISAAKSSVIGTASTNYNTLGKIETALTTEVTNRTTDKTNLQASIDTEKGRIDTILSGADTDKNTFSEIKTYIDGLTGTVSNTVTTISSGSRNLTNVVNAIETHLGTLDTTTSSLTTEVNKIETSIGLANDGGFPSPWSGNNYIDTATTVLQAVKQLDVALKNEETTKSNNIGTLANLTTSVKTSIVNAINDEVSRAKTVEGVLANLTSSNKVDLVQAINSVVSALSTNTTNLNTEKGRIDTILSGADSDKNTFSEIRTYVDGLTGNVANTSTILSGNTARNLSNIVDDIESRVYTIENSTTTSNVTKEVDRMETAIGLKSDGTYITITNSNYINDAATVIETSKLLDAQLKTTNTSIGTLTNLTSSNKVDLVQAINSVVSALANEVTARTNGDSTLTTNLNTEISARQTADTNLSNIISAMDTAYKAADTTLTNNLNAEISARQNDIGVLGNLSTTEKTNVVGAINEIGSLLTTTASIYKSTGSIENAEITLNATSRVKVSNAPFRLPLFDNVGRDNLSATNGDMIYNTELGKFQGYQNGSWINLDGTV